MAENRSYRFEPLRSSDGGVPAAASSKSPPSVTRGVSAKSPHRNESRSPSPQTEQLPPRTGKKRTLRLWCWEIVVAFFTAVCLALLVVVLHWLDGRSYTEWAYKIAPNTILAVLMAAIRACAAFPVGVCLGQIKWNQLRHPRPLYDLHTLDQASRGVFGAFQMIFTSRPGLESLGAIVLILSVAIDPLAQQFLVFPSRAVNASNETASIQTTNIYAGGNSQAAITAMELTVARSLFGDINPLEPVCTTGNCQYPNFTTLGVCSQCQDVTAQSKQSCSPGTTINQTAWASMGNYSMFSKAPGNCSYTSPSGMVFPKNALGEYAGKISPATGSCEIGVTPSMYNTTANDDMCMLFYRLEEFKTVTQNFEGLYYSNTSVAGIYAPTIGFGAANYTNNIETVYTLNNLTATEQTPNITECAIYFCEQRYSNVVYNTNSRYPTASHTQPLIMQDSPYGYNLTTSIGNHNGTYRVSTLTALDLINFLHNELATSSAVEERDSYGVTNHMYDSGDIGGVLSGLAVGLSNTIRSDQNSSMIAGDAYLTETFISVRWPWIVVPIVVALLSTSFLAATVISTRCVNGVRVWKSSALALVACELEQDVAEHKDLRQAGSLGELERVAKKMHVSLKDEDTGLLLSEFHKSKER